MQRTRAGWLVGALALTLAATGSAAARDAALHDRHGELAVYRGVQVAAQAPWRQHYLHPLRHISGQPLTEDGPVDHPHQRGLFWAWRRILVDGAVVADSWTGRNFALIDDHAREARSAGDGSTLDAHVRWRVGLDGRDVDLVAERLRVQVLRATRTQRRLHLRVELQALRAGVALAGSDDEKGYGGPSIRLVDTPALQFSRAGQRLQPAVGPVVTGERVDFAWPPDELGAARRVSIRCRVDGKPWRSWVLRSEPSMQNCAFPGRTPYPLPTDRPLRIELWIEIRS